ncbi:MAG: PIN domain-containing protein [Acidimicrobiia bacterium]
MALVLDTGPVVAYLDSNDHRHLLAQAVFDASHEAFVIPAPNLVEIDYWLRKQASVAIVREFAQDVADGAYQIESLSSDDLLRAAELEAQYNDLRLGLVDASVIAICERLGETKVATFDRRHFSVVRPRHCDAFTLLPG